jgi:uncharacterized protein (TIGR03437 family)
MFTGRLVSIFLLMALAVTAVPAQPISFLPPVTATFSGTSPDAGMCRSCLAVADFNRDGKPDIAYANYELLPNAGVLLGNGDGTFQPAVILPAVQNNFSDASILVAADFNGDGKPDLAYGTSGYPAWIILGNGDSTFQSPISVTSCVSLAAVADFNRDGKADLVCGTSILLSNGDGSFHAGITVDPNLMDSVLLTADFNHDGNPDLLLLRLSGQLAVALGHGDGTFAPDLSISTILTNPLAADFNADGKLDLVGSCTRVGLLCVLLGNGDGTFGAAITTPDPGSLSGSIETTGDFNGDGKLDLIAANAVFAGNGNGTFQLPVFFGPVTQACGAAADPAIPTYVPCAYSTIAAAVADFNGDGFPDIVAGTVMPGANGRNNSVVAVLLNDSPGDGFLTPGVSSANFSWPVATGSIVSAFGVNLAPSTEVAPSLTSPPTTLGGIRLHVRDLSTGDRLAQLLYVSPTQINYVMPSSDPYPWVGIERVGTTYVPKGISVPVSSLAAGFYSTGAALPAAWALRVVPFGTEIVPVTQCSGASGCNSVPIDVSGATVYLSLYGTGFDQASAASSACTIAGQTVHVSYAGQQSQVPGLDQANLLLPSTLSGTGATSLNCEFQTAAGVFSVTNTVNLVIE